MQNISYTFELWVSHLASMSEMRLCMFVLKSHVDILTVTWAYIVYLLLVLGPKTDTYFCSVT